MNTSLLPDSVKVFSVAELTRMVKSLLEDAFPALWVKGQISGFRRHSSGHVYLTLKDAEAQVAGVIWRSTAAALRFEPHDGLEVLARGRLDVYLPHGAYKLIIEELHPKGLGALELAFRQLRDKLAGLGYFDAARKKALPRMPRRVALVTSPTGAAVRDILEIMLRRWPAIEVWVCPVRVQGDGAAEEIAKAIRLLNQLACVEVMIVGRGGGSVEDLWAFNEEVVAQAIFASRIPVVSAVGHEIDITIADLVADCRAPTPSAAATLVVPDREEIRKELDGRRERLHQLIHRRITVGRDRLVDLSARRVFQVPLERIRDREQRLDEWSDRLRRAMQQELVRAHDRLEAKAARLETLSPLNVLGRGYTLTRRDGILVRSRQQVRPGDQLVTVVQDGQILSLVAETGPSCR